MRKQKQFIITEGWHENPPYPLDMSEAMTPFTKNKLNYIDYNKNKELIQLMKITKSELKSLIRECLKEALNEHKLSAQLNLMQEGIFDKSNNQRFVVVVKQTREDGKVEYTAPYTTYANKKEAQQHADQRNRKAKQLNKKEEHSVVTVDKAKKLVGDKLNIDVMSGHAK